MSINGSLYSDDESANIKFVFAVNDKLILYAHKQVLASATNYFDAIFNSADEEWCDDTRVSIVIDGKYEFDAFELVLRLIYGCAVEDDEWSSFAIDLIFNAAVIIKDFSLDKFEYKLYTNYEIRANMFNEEISAESCFVLIYRLLEKSIQQRLNCMTIIYLNYIDKNAYKVVETLGNYIVNNHIAPEVLIEIFKRDSFGVSEIQIFDVIRKWFARNRNSKSGRKRIKQYSGRLIKTIRLELLTIPELTSAVKLANIIADKDIDKVIQKLKSGKANKRYRNYTEASNTVREFNYQQIWVTEKIFPILRQTRGKSSSVQRHMAPKVTIALKRPEMINHISFYTVFKNDTHIDAVMYYYIEVQSKSQWHRVCDNTHNMCFSNEKQVIGFKTNLLVSHITIVGMNTTGNFMLKKLKYKLMPTVVNNAIAIQSDDE